jgi:hypothetical protein
MKSTKIKLLFMIRVPCHIVKLITQHHNIYSVQNFIHESDAQHIFLLLVAYFNNHSVLLFLM